MKRPRLRDLGIIIGDLPPGPLNAITDIAGVRVGHTTLISGEGLLQPGSGPVRTGVTVILPHPGNIFRQKVPAAVYTINGFGKPAGFEQVRELGLIEAPIALTNTLNVGLVLDALVQYAIRQSPEIGVSTSSVNILVGETNDMFLNDLQGRHVHAEHVWQALESAAGGAVEEGNVGAGTGTVCLGWKGGIGSSSRCLPPALGGYRLGALVQTNFGGGRASLVVNGFPVGEWLRRGEAPGSALAGPGSVMIVLAMDAPLSAAQMERVCVRAMAGLARTGSQFDHGSGDFVIAFSTAHTFPHHPAGYAEYLQVAPHESSILNGLFHAAAEAVEEAVLNSLCAAQTMSGRDGNTAYALPVEQLVELL